MIKSICVFCGSSLGNNKNYENAAIELGKLFSENQITLVYGGSSIGLMNAIAESVIDKEGKTIGIIPRFMMSREIAHMHLTDLIWVETMHERKYKMMENSDAFIAMPGGFGTFDELFEVITWRQLNLHQKPIGILNIDGYFDSLISLIKNTIDHGFAKNLINDFLIIENSPKALLDKMLAH